MVSILKAHLSQQMKWEMENEEVEAVLEKIWDLHDKLSDVIHSISRTHFLSSISVMRMKKSNRISSAGSDGEDPTRSGFVYYKDWDKDSAVAEAKSLNAIRSALENLEEQLEFFHTVQMQQKAERDAALARLEQSRVILALKLGAHHGKRYKVIEEALEFVGDVKDGTCFVSPEDLCGPSSAAPVKAALQPKYDSSVFVKVVLSGLSCAKQALKLDTMVGVVANAALFTISMLAMVHLQRTACKDKNDLGSNRKQDRTGKKISQVDAASYRFDVLSARG